MQQKHLALIAGLVLLGAAAVLLPRLMQAELAPASNGNAASAGESGSQGARGGDPATGPVVRAESTRDAASSSAREPSESIRVRGRVVDRYAAAVAGANVFLEFAPGAVPRAGFGRLGRGSEPAVSAADGTFEFVSPRPTRLRVVLRVAHRDFVPARFDRDLDDTATGTQVGDLVLEAGGEVLGRVTGLDGAPIPDAEVRLQPALADPAREWRPADAPPVELHTDRTGQFRFVHVAAGQCVVMATAARHQQGQSPPFAVEPERLAELQDIRLATGFELAGVVVDAHRDHIVHADVLLRAARGGRTFRTFSDGDGRFTIDHLPGTACDLTIDAPGYLRFERLGIEPPQQTAPLQVVLQDGLHLAGVVTDLATGAPVTEFGVDAHRLRGSSDPAGAGIARDQRPGALASTALFGSSIGKEAEHADGRFEVTGLQEGIYVVVVRSRQHQPWHSPEIELRAGIAAAEVQVALARGRSVRGAVVDGEGRPLAQARVELRKVDPGPAASVDGAPNIFRTLMGSGLPVGDSRTDPEGRFLIEHAAPGHYRVIASAAHHDTRSSEPFDVDGDVDGMLLRLGALGGLEGRVLGLREAEATGARVLAVPAGGLGETSIGHGARLVVEVAADGRYHFEQLAAGGYRVRAFIGSPTELFAELLRPPGGNGPAADVVVHEGATATLDVEIERIAAGSVSGTVTDNTAPAAGYRITLTRADRADSRNGARWVGFAGDELTAITDPAGGYALPRVPAGPYEVQVRGAAGRAIVLAAQQVTIVADRATSLDLHLVTSRIRGRILASDAADPTTLQGQVTFLPGVGEYPAEFTVWRRDRAYATVAVHDGSFTSEALAPGQYLVVLEVAGRRRATRSVTVAPGQDLEIELVAGDRP
ncbi:MAG TPA: carboxypeptidase regulatory-like domain-containing protein [Planctomycetota bacterium]|nr:carboxypeptidase regulatory-like domain-containing protein [Planctomycetota bacterium]